jgi:hypothetical protein
MPKDIKLKTSIKATTKTSDAELETDLVATVTPFGGESIVLNYDRNTESGAVISGTTSHVGVKLETQYFEEITESFERSRGLLDGGIEFSLKIPKSLGGIEMSFKRKPRKEKKTTKKQIFKAKS